MRLPDRTLQNGTRPGRSFTDRDTQPLDSPGPSYPFVDREDEIQLIIDKLENGGLEGKQIRSGLVCYWGAFGMGKSWLLKELQYRFAYPWPKPPEPDCSHPAAAARLDLSYERSPSLWPPNNGFDCDRLIREMWQQLAEQLGEAPPPESMVSLDDRAIDFVNWVTKWATEKCTPILLLDTMDDLIDQDPSAFTWLEKHMIEPLAITNRVVFVFSSRGVINKWGSFQIQRRIHPYKLTGFSEKEAGKAVLAGEQVGRYLISHTFGHPFATQRLASYIQNTLGVDLDKSELVEIQGDYEILKKVLGTVIKNALNVLPERSRERAQVISILRWVNIDTVRWLCEQTNLEQLGLGDGYYQDQVISEMHANHLLNWSSTRNCWVMDPVLRQLMAHNLEINNPIRFKIIHQAAYNYYIGYLMKYPAYLEDHATELAFHLGWLLKLPDADSVMDQFQTWWEAFPPPGNVPPFERWAGFISALEDDKEARMNLPDAVLQMLIAKSKKYSIQNKGESNA